MKRFILLISAIIFVPVRGDANTPNQDKVRIGRFQGQLCSEETACLKCTNSGGTGGRCMSNYNKSGVQKNANGLASTGFFCNVGADPKYEVCRNDMLAKGYSTGKILDHTGDGKPVQEGIPVEDSEDFCTKDSPLADCATGDFRRGVDAGIGLAIAVPLAAAVVISKGGVLAPFIKSALEGIGMNPDLVAAMVGKSFGSGTISGGAIGGVTYTTGAFTVVSAGASASSVKLAVYITAAAVVHNGIAGGVVMLAAALAPEVRAQYLGPVVLGSKVASVEVTANGLCYNDSQVGIGAGWYCNPHFKSGLSNDYSTAEVDLLKKKWINFSNYAQPGGCSARNAMQRCFTKTVEESKLLDAGYLNPTDIGYCLTTDKGQHWRCSTDERNWKMDEIGNLLRNQGFVIDITHDTTKKEVGKRGLDLTNSYIPADRCSLETALRVCQHVGSDAKGMCFFKDNSWRCDTQYYRGHDIPATFASYHQWLQNAGFSLNCAPTDTYLATSSGCIATQNPPVAESECSAQKALRQCRDSHGNFGLCYSENSTDWKCLSKYYQAHDLANTFRTHHNWLISQKGFMLNCSENETSKALTTGCIATQADAIPYNQCTANNALRKCRLSDGHLGLCYTEDSNNWICGNKYYKADNLGETFKQFHDWLTQQKGFTLNCTSSDSSKALTSGCVATPDFIPHNQCGTNNALRKCRTSDGAAGLCYTENSNNWICSSSNYNHADIATTFRNFHGWLTSQKGFTLNCSADNSTKASTTGCIATPNFVPASQCGVSGNALRRCRLTDGNEGVCYSEDSTNWVCSSGQYDKNNPAASFANYHGWLRNQKGFNLDCDATDVAKINTGCTAISATNTTCAWNNMGFVCRVGGQIGRCVGTANGHGGWYPECRHVDGFAGFVSYMRSQNLFVSDASGDVVKGFNCINKPDGSDTYYISNGAGWRDCFRNS